MNSIFGSGESRRVREILGDELEQSRARERRLDEQLRTEATDSRRTLDKKNKEINELSRNLVRHESENKKLTNEVSNLKRHIASLERNSLVQKDVLGSIASYVLVLLDLDHYVFLDDFYKAGVVGGSKAAMALTDEVRLHLEGLDEDMQGVKIVVLGFANLTPLSNQLKKHGFIDHTGMFWEFVRGFNGFDANFIIAEGAGKKEHTGGADDKIMGALGLWGANQKCRHILFGGCHDGDYYKVLQREPSPKRITLIRLEHFHKRYDGLGMHQTRRFRSVFVNEGLPSKNESTTAPVLQQTQPLCKFYAQGHCKWEDNCKYRHENDIPSLPLTRGDQNRPPSRFGEAVSVLGAVRPPAPPPSRQIQQFLPEWKSNDNNFIPVNSAKQRMDFRLVKPPREVMDEFVGLRKQNPLCRAFHLQGSCDGSGCTMDHNPYLPERVKDAIRWDARRNACNQGGACRFKGCIFAHMCIIDNCWGGTPDCKLPKALHEVDPVTRSWEAAKGAAGRKV